jgi:uncharacterized protein YjdB
MATGVSSGTATISYILTNGCGSDTATTIVNVNGLPASAGTITGVTTLYTGTTTTLSDTTGSGSWSSSNTSVATVDAAGVVYGVSAGTANISYAVTNSCGSIWAVVTVTVSDVISSVGYLSGGATSISLAPNPASSKITLIVSGGSHDNQVTVSNISGTIVRSLTFTDNKADINVSGLAQGVYLFRIRAGNEVFTERVVIR